MDSMTELWVSCINTSGGTGTASWTWTYQAMGVNPISLGGTNNASLAVTNGGSIYTDGSKLMNTGAGTSGQYLKSNGAAAPSWDNPSGTQTVVSKTNADSPYTVLSSDQNILVDTSGGAITINLPAAASSNGRILTIKKTSNDFTACTIDGNASETIDGSTTTTINTRYESITIICNGSNWFTTVRRIPAIWTSYTPGTQGLGTPTITDCRWMRQGENIIIQSTITTGTVTASEARVDLPTGLTVASRSTTLNAGFATQNDASSATPIFILVDGGESYFQFSNSSSGAGSKMVPALGNVVFVSSSQVGITAIIPISGWNG